MIRNERKDEILERFQLGLWLQLGQGVGLGLDQVKIIK